MRCLPILSLVTMAACAPRSAPDPQPPVHRAWHVEGGFLRDADGRAVTLRGANWSGKHKDPPYFDFHQAQDISRMRTDWGMNAARFLIEWAAVEPQPDTYDDAYLDQVAQRMDWAAAANILVVLDMHQDVYGPGFLGGNGAPRWTCSDAHYQAFVPQAQWFLNYLDPNVVACFDQLWTDTTLQDHAARTWRHVAQKLAGHPAIIGFDVINEPYLGSFGLDSFEPQGLQPFYERVVPAVREAAPDWIAFLEPSSMRNLGFASTLAPFPFNNVMYAPHSYDSSAERGMGFDPARRADVLDNAQRLAQEAAALHTGLWIGEFGGTSSSPNFATYMRAELDAMDSVMAGAMIWEYGKNTGYGLLNPDGTDKTDLLDTVVRPYPERVAGNPTSWSYSPETRIFQLDFVAQADTSVVTVVSAPLRIWPAGPHVQCNGCTALVRDGRVEVRAAAAGNVSVLLQPP